MNENTAIKVRSKCPSCGAKDIPADGCNKCTWTPSGKKGEIVCAMCNRKAEARVPGKGGSSVPVCCTHLETYWDRHPDKAPDSYLRLKRDLEEHPEWFRGAAEPRSEYVTRMAKTTREMISRLTDKVSSPDSTRPGAQRGRGSSAKRPSSSQPSAR